MTKEKLIAQLSKRGKGKYYAVFNEFREVVLNSTPIELINYLTFQFDLSDTESACLNYTGIRYAQINFKKKYSKDGDKAALHPQAKTGSNGKPWQFNDASETNTGKPKFFKKQPI